jgi:murein hydrolase activator
MSPIRGFLVLIAAAAIAWPAPAQAPAASAPDRFTLDDLRRVERARDEALARLRELERTGARAERDAAAVDADLMAAAADTRRREVAAAAAEARLLALQQEIADARALVDADEAATQDLLAALMTVSSRPPPGVLTPPERAADSVRAAILMGEAAPALAARAEALKARIDALKRLTEDQTAERQRLALAEQALSARRAEIEALAGEKRLARAGLAAETERRRQVAEALAAEAETLRALLEGLERSAPPAPRVKPRAGAKAPDALPRIPPGPQGTAARPPAAAPGQGVAPAAGRFVRRFGQPVGGERHPGLTLETRPGAQVMAPRDGVVQFAGDFRSYGQMIILDTGDGALVILSGLDALYPEAGQWVLAGEPVGRMSDSRTPAPQLYVEVRNKGQTVDPAAWLGWKG